MAMSLTFLLPQSNIGNDAKSLWQRYDPTVGREFLVTRQQMHVSILSIGSFLGRLSSGMYFISRSTQRQGPPFC